MKRPILIAALLLATASHAIAANIYVNNQTGNDKLSGHKAVAVGEDGPLQSIAKALYMANSSDRIVIAKTDSPYREQLAVSGCRLRGTKDRPFVITSDGAILDGTVAAAEGAWQQVNGDVFGMKPRRLAYQQVLLQGKPLEQAQVASWHSADDILKPMQWSLTDACILLKVEKNRLPESYPVRHAGLQTGITLYETEHVVIEGLVIQGFQQDGINAHELAKHCLLRNVECRANGRSGLSVGGVSQVRVERGNFYDNGRVQVRAVGLSHLELAKCDVGEADEANANVEDYFVRGGKLTVDGVEIPTTY